MRSKKWKRKDPVILAHLKPWYNGYTWNMQTWVYSPFSLLNFMAEPVFRNFWFGSGTPSFFVRRLKKFKVFDVEDRKFSATELAAFDVNNPDLASLLFQTGYRTIKKNHRAVVYTNSDTRTEMWRTAYWTAC